MKCYDIFYRNVKIGVAHTEELGLYTLFQCICQLPDEGLHRIYVQYGSACFDLGLCVPENNLFAIRKRIATKKLNKSIPQFYVSVETPECSEFVPIDAFKEFKCISRLLNGRFSARGQIRGMIFTDDL